ncbi:MAG: MerR family transcriptional regulator [bacterium]
MINVGKDKTSLQIYLEKIQKPYNKIQPKLVKRFLPVSDLKKILGITKRQLSNWESVGIKTPQKKTAKRSWRRFSVIDIFGFMVVLLLRKMGLPLATCGRVYQNIHLNMEDNSCFVYHMAIAEDVYLVIDVIKERFYPFIRSLYKTDHMLIHKLNPQVIINLRPLFFGALQKVKMRDFSMTFEQDTKIAFNIEDEIIRFNLTPEEKKCVEKHEQLWISVDKNDKLYKQEMRRKESQPTKKQQ